MQVSKWLLLYYGRVDMIKGSGFFGCMFGVECHWWYSICVLIVFLKKKTVFIGRTVAFFIRDVPSEEAGSR